MFRFFRWLVSLFRSKAPDISIDVSIPVSGPNRGGVDSNPDEEDTKFRPPPTEG